MHSPTRALTLIAGLAALVFLLLTVAVLSHAEVLQNVDSAISDSAHRFAVAHPRWRSTMAAITRTGSTTYIGPAVSAACLVLLLRRRWPQAAFVGAATVVTIGLRLLIVAQVARPRPAGWLTSAAGWSFPSGHSTAAATVGLTAVIVGWPLLRRRRDRLVLASIAGAWAVAVGVSRVALSVHWPSDVLGAWLLVAAVVPAIAASFAVMPASVPGKPRPGAESAPR